MAVTLVIKCTNDHLAPALKVATPFGIFPGPAPAFSYHLLSHKPRQDIYMSILTHLPEPINIGCLALVDSGKVCQKMHNIPSILTGSYPFATMVSQAGLHGQQPTNGDKMGKVSKVSGWVIARSGNRFVCT